MPPIELPSRSKGTAKTVRMLPDRLRAIFTGLSPGSLRVSRTWTARPACAARPRVEPEPSGKRQHLLDAIDIHAAKSDGPKRIPLDAPNDRPLCLTQLACRARNGLHYRP